MSYSKLNQSLVESFGELEKMCNFVFDDKHGVTCYIDKLDEKTLSKDDREILKKLKSIRHKRNQLSHGDVSFDEECADEEDIEFLEEFMKSITKGSDPLKLYFAKKPSSKKEPEEAPDTDAALIGGGVLFVVVVIAVICIAIAIVGNYIH